MSYSIIISGHIPGPHNDLIVGIVEDVVAKVRAAGDKNVQVSGYTNDGTNLTLTTPPVDQDAFGVGHGDLPE